MYHHHISIGVCGNELAMLQEAVTAPLNSQEDLSWAKILFGGSWWRKKFVNPHHPKTYFWSLYRNYFSSTINTQSIKRIILNNKKTNKQIAVSVKVWKLLIISEISQFSIFLTLSICALCFMTMLCSQCLYLFQDKPP